MEEDNTMLLYILVFLLTISYCTVSGYTLTTSSDNATVGLDFTFTCVTTETLISFTRDITNVCIITGGNTDGTCVFGGGYNTEYTYTCNPTTNIYTVTIPGSYLTESLHGTRWKCQNPSGGGTSNTKILYVNVPVSSVILLSTPANKNPVEVAPNNDQTFSCTTNTGRPSSRIQWYLSTTNITSSTSPQPDVCNTDCSDDKIISSSVLTYTGNINDDGKILYCTAVNIEGWRVVRSSDKTIVIWYEPTSTPSVIQIPPGPINESSTVILTCDIKGGNPLATVTWTCEGSFTIIPTGIPPTNTATSSVQLTVNSNDNGKLCTCIGHHPVWTTDKTTSHTLDVRYQPTTSITVMQTPVGPINEGNKVTLTCTMQGGNPVATIMWSCDGSTQITPTGSPSTVDAISSVELVTSKNNNGQICTCTGRHILWTNDKTQQHSIIVYYAPSKIPSIQQIPQDPIMVDTNVTLICTVANGNPSAMLSWNCTGPTLSSTVGNITSHSVLLSVNTTNIMCICSAIHPVSSYRPRVEHTMHAYSIDSKADIECNASATVIICCSLTPQGAPVNPVKWLHHFKNRTIRSLRGDISGSDFTLTLPFCNYQDIGSYSCVWNTSYELVDKLVIVSVSGPPIISDQTVVVKENEVLVSSLFYAVPHPENPIWYAAGNVLPIGKKYRSSTFPTKIVLRLYNEIVDLDGYISTLFIDDFHSIDQGTYTFTIRNPFGSLNVDIDTRETTQSKTDECSSTELSVGVFVGSLVACIIATAAVSTCLQMIICQQIKKSKRVAKDRSNQYQDIAMSTTTNVYDTVNE